MYAVRLAVSEYSGHLSVVSRIGIDTQGKHKVKQIPGSQVDRQVQVAWLRVGCGGVQVNYVGKAANLYEDAGYKLHGSAYVINKYLGTTWLWDRIRVSGGAYGGFSDFDSHSCIFTYLSYRDPNLLKSVDNYDGEPCPSASTCYGFIVSLTL